MAVNFEWIEFGDGVVRKSSIAGVFYGECPTWHVWIALPGAAGPTESFDTRSEAKRRYDEVLRAAKGFSEWP
jgi:hypothetical protein